MSSKRLDQTAMKYSIKYKISYEITPNGVEIQNKY